MPEVHAPSPSSSSSAPKRPVANASQGVPSAAPRPVRSAKDAINAMYAGDKKLSGMLAQSAKNIHHTTSSRASQPAPRPSANTVFRQSAAKTSLKLKPEAPRVVAAKPASAPMSAPASTSPRTFQDIVRPAAAETIRQVRASGPQTVLVKTSAGVAARPTYVAPKPTPKPAAKPAQPTTGSANSAARLTAQPARDPARRRPLDSIKNRFRPAPKDYATVTPPKGSVHLYGSTPEPQPAEPYTEIPDNLGVIEDYKGDKAGTFLTEADLAAARERKAAEAVERAELDKMSKDSALNGEKYALGATSPFFLKSVSVEKRPLSGGPARPQTVDASIYLSTTTPEPVDKKSDKTAKSAKALKSPKSARGSKNSAPAAAPEEDRPTVIIPASRRSSAPLFILLIFTVILGAAVGALAYLFFFQ